MKPVNMKLKYLLTYLLTLSFSIISSLQVYATDHGFTNKRISLKNNVISFLDK